MKDEFMIYDLRFTILREPQSGRQKNGGSKMKSSVRSAMLIVRTLRMNQAPLGAACLSREVLGSTMPLLTELGKRVIEPCSYKHGAPDGAFSSAPFASLRFCFAHLPIMAAARVTPTS